MQERFRRYTSEEGGIISRKIQTMALLFPVYMSEFIEKHLLDRAVCFF